MPVQATRTSRHDRDNEHRPGEERRILVVVDIADESLSLVDTAVLATGAELLPFEEPSAMT